MEKTITLSVIGVLLLIVTAILAVSLYSANTQIDTDKVMTSALNSQINTLQSEISNLNSSVAAAQSQVKSLQDEVAQTNQSSTSKDAIISGLQSQIVNLSVQVQSQQTSSLSGKVFDNIQLGSSLDTIPIVLTNSNFNKLYDTHVSFMNSNYNVEEKVIVQPSLSLEVSGQPGADSNFGSKPYMVTSAPNSLEYGVYFIDSVPYTNISSSNNLDISFLGQDFNIVGATSNSITVQQGTEVVLQAGSSISVNGKNLTVLGLSPTAASFTYGSNGITIVDGATKKFDGISITIVSVNGWGSSGQGVVDLIYSLSDTQKTITSGDEYTQGDYTYVFGIDTTAGMLNDITLTYTPLSSTLSDTVPPVTVGGSISFPNQYVSMTFNQLSSVTYSPVTVSLQNVGELNGANAIVIYSPDKKIVSGSNEVSKLYITNDGVFHFIDSNDKVQNVTSAQIVNGDYTATIKYSGTSLILSDSLGNVSIDTQIDNRSIGVPREADTTDVVYNALNVGTVDNDVLTLSGVILQSVKSNVGSDRVQLSIPSDYVKGTVVFS